MKAAQDRQKSYVDKQRKDLEFEVGDLMFLKVSPRKSVRRIEKGGKLSPRYIRPYEVSERIGPVAYRILLPQGLAGIHDVFHASQLCKYYPDPSHIISLECMQLKSELTYEEQSVHILDRQYRELRNQKIPQVKVLWRNHNVEEATWEQKDLTCQQYPELFQHSALDHHYHTWRTTAGAARRMTVEKSSRPATGFFVFRRLTEHLKSVLASIRRGEQGGSTAWRRYEVETAENRW